MSHHVRHHAIRWSLMAASILLPSLCPAAAHHDAIETIGIGRVDPKLTNETQRRATARDAAIEEAQAKMLAILEGVSSDGQTQDKESSRSGILKGAKVIKTEWVADDQCRVTLRLEHSGQKSRPTQ